VSLLSRTIVYTYDALSRLTAADYSTGEAFAYEYDPAGNRLAQTIAGDTTAYTYDAANRLTTAQASNDGLVWHYAHDGNGNLARQTPGGTAPAEGETRYTYNAANQLVQAELYTAGGYTTLSEAAYNGDGVRVALTTYALGVPQAVHYVVAGGDLLAMESGGNTTLYLTGQQTVLAEFSEDGWSYPLYDGTGTPRQMTDKAGEVTLARSYDPFGGPMGEDGTYESTFGFYGGAG
jgi:YD repeat-containing protein